MERLAVIFLGAVGYALTMAPTVSFWDCGEFIAASNVLGIPHPPGYPLFILLGRVFILLFGWIRGPAFAVNLFSVISSILCCLLIFEITVKILPKELEGRIYFGRSLRNLLGFFAASISLFGDTFWFNAVEAGSYGISMFVIMLEIWAVLKWKETLENKYLLLILYISFLSLGFHTFALLPLPAILIFVLVKKRKFPLRFFAAAAFFIILGLSSQLYLPVRSSTEPLLNENNPANTENFFNVLNRKQYGDMSMFERALYRRASPLSQFGFSENIGYLGYHLNQWFPAPLGAQVSGAWGEGFLEKFQFFHRIVFEFLIIAVLAGIWLYRKNSGVALVFIMFLLSSAGLVLYLNFADGTRADSYNAKRWNAQTGELRKFVPDSIPDLPSLVKLNRQFSFYYALPAEMRNGWLKSASSAEGLRTVFAWEEALKEQGKKMANPPRPVHREVRNRDYFFTPAFLFFAIMAAIACRKAGKFAAYGLAFAWLIPFLTNFHSHNRSGDFIARDFAVNVLNSVPQNGILITYGDNDTFPLWYMELAENYRTDVVVINESLFYGDWYREQVFKNYPDLEPGDLLSQLIENNFPEKNFSFMLGARPKDYEEFSENMPIVGLVRSLGMEDEEADSLLLANLTENYQYSEYKSRNQEANAQTLDIYRYLARIALQKEPDEKQREKLLELLR
ncbi:MAG: DUF2723 domain-containing protein [Candidatus Fibromonas sp.]|jgi:hypothetical protein|nr:DUF2723 domain-containing protein [Candidatus Fibromonas sp.]